MANSWYSEWGQNQNASRWGQTSAAWYNSQAYPSRHAPVAAPCKTMDLGTVPNSHMTKKAESEDTASAVVSVKKSSKGCAVVILRDRDVLERSVLQRVAVVDGVCVEVKRHTKKKLPEEEQPLGVFVAWGFRVERRVTVTEEGLEAYFNSLAGAPCPEGLIPKAPFKEGILSFSLASSGRAALNMKPQFEQADSALLLEDLNCEPEHIHALWAAKKGIDDHWNRPPPPMGRNLLLRIARSQLFPHSGEGVKEHENRAGDKLAELAKAVGLLDGVPAKSAFLDLCGGPGAWSQFLLDHDEVALRGFGFTLRSASGDAKDWQAEEKDDWYDDLLARKDWRALWGVDGTGNLLKTGNLEQVANKLAQERVFLVVADGGFSDESIPANLLELYFYRLFLAELLTAVSCLQPGGRFVCKFYSTFSAATSSLLYLTTRLFDTVKVVKPMTSRVTGPERYLVAMGMKSGEEVQSICKALAESHKFGGDRSLLKAPLITPLVALTDLRKDMSFEASLRSMATTLCNRQALALRAAVERAEFLEDVATGAACDSPPSSPRHYDKENVHTNYSNAGVKAKMGKSDSGLRADAPAFVPAGVLSEPLTDSRNGRRGLALRA